MTRSRLPGRVDGWFAAPAPAERLAAFRILLGLFTLAYLLIRFPVFWSLADGRSGRFDPVGVLGPLSGPLPAVVIYLAVIGAVLSAVAFTLGWRFRISGPVLAALMLVLGSYRNSWGQLLHFENLMVLHLLVVGWSPAADVVALDARPTDAGAGDERGGGGRSRGGAGPSIRYGFPLRLAAVITAVTYVLAGVAKLRYGGVEWMLGDTLQNHVAYSSARLELLGGYPSPFAGVVVDQAWLFPPLATASVLIELGAPLALLWRRYRTRWVVSTWLMHVGIVALMFVVFPYPLFGLAFAPMYDLERLVASARSRMPRSGTPRPRLLPTKYSGTFPRPGAT